jgi:hypothetical protein
MRPFPLSFDPLEPRDFLPVPDTFETTDEYLDVMKHNVLSELSASVTAHSPEPVVAIVMGLEGDSPSVPAQTVDMACRSYRGSVCAGLVPTFEFPAAPDSLDGTWYYRLLRAPQERGGGFYIVHVDKPSRIVAFGEPPSSRTVQLSEMPFFPLLDSSGERTRVHFQAFDFVGDLIAAYTSIEALRKASALEQIALMHAVISAGGTKGKGLFQPLCRPLQESVRQCNTQQLSVLDTGLSDNLEIVQGPPGTGKTRLIREMLASKLPPGSSALVTSTNNQAIDNLCEHLEGGESCKFVVLGQPRRFLHNGLMHLFKHCLETRVLTEICPLLALEPAIVQLEVVMSCGPFPPPTTAESCTAAPNLQYQLLVPRKRTDHRPTPEL